MKTKAYRLKIISAWSVPLFLYFKKLKEAKKEAKFFKDQQYKTEIEEIFIEKE